MELDGNRGSLEMLDEPQCLRLLRCAAVGRLGLTANALPVVLPVNFTLDDHTIVFCTEPGLKLDAAMAGDVACMETDSFDRLEHTGWSVLATGRLHIVTDDERLEAFSRLPVRPWALRSARHYVELPIELLSGRRITHARHPEVMP